MLAKQFLGAASKVPVRFPAWGLAPSDGWPALLLLSALIALLGCQSMATHSMGPSDLDGATNGLAHAAASGDPASCTPDPNKAPPAELRKVSLSQYRLAPPDILLISLFTTTPKEPYFVQSMDILRIIVAGAPPEQPIAGDYQVQPGGLLNLGPMYGSVNVDGLSIAEVRDAIFRHLQGTLVMPEASVSLVESSAIQQISSEKVVAPDGTINLGIYGSVYVTGMTLEEARAAVESHLGEFFADPKVYVDVFAYNSKFYYIVLEGAGFGDQVFQRPVVGNETVLDAIASLGGLSQLSSKRIWLSRPAPQGVGCDQILPVDWNGITRNANAASNYQLLPGDRIFVNEDKMYAFGNMVNRVLNPMERIFGFTLLGSQTIQTLQRFPGGGFFF